jgi:hypothetical protein
VSPRNSQITPARTEAFGLISFYDRPQLLSHQQPVFWNYGLVFAPTLWVTAAEFAGLSAQLLSDMRNWIAEASKDETISSSELAVLQTAMIIIERGTFKGTETKPDTTN